MSTVVRVRRARSDRGAVIPILALSIVTLMIMTAFSLDVGRQILRRREAQAVADVVALDMSRLIDGRTAQAIQSDPKWTNTLSQAAARNNWPVAGLTPETGHWDTATETFTPLNGTFVPDAVRVTARDTIDFYFAPVIGITEGSVTRSAVSQPSGKTFGGLGSVFAGFQFYEEPGASAQYNLEAEYRSRILNVVFSHQFGVGASAPTGLGLDALGYKGISNGNVRLDDMAAAGGFGSADEMLNANMTAREFLTAQATAMQNSGNASDVAAGNEMAQFASQASTTNHVRMGDFVELTQPGSGSAADYTINALALMQAGGQLMNGGNFFSTTMATSIPGVPSVPITVAIIEGMKFKDGRQGSGPCHIDPNNVGCGPQTSQVRVAAEIPLTLNLTPFGVPLVQATTIPMIFESAKATSTFERVSCGQPTPTSQVDFEVITNGVAAHIGSASDAALQASGTLNVQAEALLHGSINLGLLSINLDSATSVEQSRTFKAGAIYNGDLNQNLGVLGAVESHTFTGNNQTNILPTSWRYSGGVGNTSVSTTMFNSLGITNSLLNTAISSALNSQLANLDELFISPLLSSLGVTIAGADGTIRNVTCSPKLVD